MLNIIDVSKWFYVIEIQNVIQVSKKYNVLNKWQAYLYYTTCNQV